MTANRSRLSGMTPRQIGTIVVFILVMIMIAWQVWGLLGSSKTAPKTTVTTTTTANQPLTQGQANVMAMQQPKPTTLIKPSAPMSQRELELMKMQQETQAKYLAALNELQMLRLQREITETNQAIMASKLATVTAQKNILNLLSPPPPPPPVAPETYGQSLVTPSGTTVTTTAKIPIQAAQQPQEINYTVVSVSRILGKWTAVIGYQGTLFNVSVGDVLTPDNSKVISINKSGVTLSKDGKHRKISMVPII